jgi:methionyl-tRNA formyltransferase
MNYIFFGTPEFAAIILEKLIKAGWPPLAVVCNPDRPVGRKKIITPPPTKVLAQKYNIPVIQSIQQEIFANYQANFFVVAAYAKILRPEIFKIPLLGTIGVHPSLLPEYRGSSPIQSVILNNEKETGVTLFLIDEKVDHGKILAISRLPLRLSENYETLLKKLAELSGDLLIETLPKFLKNEITPLPQEELQATYTKKFITEDGYVDPVDLSAAQNGASLEKAVMIERKIRALNPEPGVWTFMNIKSKQKRVKLLEAELVDGKLKLTKIQIEGGKPQNI